MTHNNRGRLTVALGDKWQLYTHTLPPNSQALGTVTREGDDTGALVRIEATGIYVQANAGAIRSLPQAKVVAALREVDCDPPPPHAKPGRPEEMQGGKRRNVYLDDASWAKACQIGNGNASEGIRTALASAG